MTFTSFTPEENTWMRRDTEAAFIQLITFAVCTGIDQFADKTWGPAKTYHARVTTEAAAFYDTGGEVVKSTATIHFYPVATDMTELTALGEFPDDARITLPDGTQPRILGMEPSYDGLGIWLWTVRT
jgi:hypothetical protein